MTGDICSQLDWGPTPRSLCSTPHPPTWPCFFSVLAGAGAASALARATRGRSSLPHTCAPGAGPVCGWGKGGWVSWEGGRRGQAFPGITPLVQGSKGLCFQLSWSPLLPPLPLSWSRLHFGPRAPGAGSVPSITSLSFSADWFLSQMLAVHSFPSSVSPRLAVLVFCFPILLSPGLLFAAPSLLPFLRQQSPPRSGGGVGPCSSCQHVCWGDTMTMRLPSSRCEPAALPHTLSGCAAGRGAKCCSQHLLPLAVPLPWLRQASRGGGQAAQGLGLSG